MFEFLHKICTKYAQICKIVQINPNKALIS